MKIGLLSFHNAVNYGASLQAVALQKVLESNDFNCEYLNYQNSHRRHAYSMTHHFLNSLKKREYKNAIKYALGSPFMWMRKRRFGRFYKKHLKCTKKIYTTSREAEVLNDQYAKFIVGSDQVWNPVNNGMDSAFLLSFVSDDSKKISYSSSFGTAVIPDAMKNDYIKYLSCIKDLSVREIYGVKLVKDLINREPSLVLDPVFLLPVSEWLKFAHPKKRKEKYIFSYTNRPAQLDSFFKISNFDMQGKKIYKLSRHLTFFDLVNPVVRVKYSISPSSFLSTIRDAELIVSASFHCIALSIIFNKPFVAILTGDKGKDERILSILTLLNLEDRVLTKQMTADQVLREIDYNSVNKKLCEMRKSSLNFLLDAIKN